jgi:hypothetical protein
VVEDDVAVYFVFAIVLSKQSVLLLVAAERFNTKTNSPRVGVGSSPAGLCARLRKLDASELPRH